MPTVWEPCGQDARRVRAAPTSLRHGTGDVRVTERRTLREQLGTPVPGEEAGAEEGNGRATGNGVPASPGPAAPGTAREAAGAPHVGPVEAVLRHPSLALLPVLVLVGVALAIGL